jgi:hypothetical protein
MTAPVPCSAPTAKEINVAANQDQPTEPRTTRDKWVHGGIVISSPDIGVRRAQPTADRLDARSNRSSR